jgi:hypothetical protein
MQVDYIIVGLGLAGLAFTKELEKNEKSYLVFENHSQNSSMVAGGVYNPVVLKRFTPVWNATEQLTIALPFYEDLEIQFNKKYHFKFDIYRIFKSVEEQNNWFMACDNPVLSNYMSTKLINEKHEGILADFGYGKLINTGRIDTKTLLEDYRDYLLKRDLIKYESFQYSELKIAENGVEYKGLKASKIVFCEGFEHIAGIRPTVKDRRPLVGKHPKYPNLTVLNGLGTRGVMIAPTVAKALYDHLEKGIALDKEISIARFL